MTAPLLLVVALLAVAAGGCTRRVPPAAPSGEAVLTNRYVVGVPYQINGRWYTPRENFEYDQTGHASFYGGERSGVDFHGRRTANGEVYDMNAMTAAHTTLPLPTIARVTRLDNGRAVTVRINDRGPFVEGRIIDLSRRAAQLLGMERAGVAPVRVPVMAEESRALRDALVAGQPPPAIPQLVQVATPGPGDSGPITVAGLIDQAPVPALPAAVVAGPGGSYSAEPRWDASGRPIDPPPAPPAGAAPADAVPERPAAARPAPSGTIYVQAGSYATSANAERVRQRLQGYGRSHISAVRVDGRNLYRVRIGPLRTNGEASRMRQRIAGVAPDARIVVD